MSLIFIKQNYAHENFIDYSVFVSFFPLLVAGPIERATHLLPQVKVHENLITQKPWTGFGKFCGDSLKKLLLQIIAPVM